MTGRRGGAQSPAGEPAGYGAADRRALAEAEVAGAPLRCPACGGAVSRREIGPKRELPYVRRRVWLLCAGCKRSAVVDIRSDARP